MRPDLGQVKDVVVILLGLLGCHGLNIALPSWEVTALNGIEEILGGIIRRAAGNLSSFVLRKEAPALLTPEMNLAVDELAVFVDKLEGVARIAVHLTVTIWDTTVAEEDHDLVKRFL